MDLGKKIFELRTEKNITREKLGKLIGTSGAIIGKYERSERTPSVEIARKIATVLEVSLDYLVGSTDLMLDKSIVNRIQNIQKLNDEDKGHLFALMDAFLLKCNIQSNLAI
jgi:transcriptional regulator with XRE-family HTH domain